MLFIFSVRGRKEKMKEMLLLCEHKKLFPVEMLLLGWKSRATILFTKFMWNI